jgi:exopolysaccharide production protein ExoZ
LPGSETGEQCYGFAGMSTADESKNAGLQVGRAVAALSVAYFHSYIALRNFQPGSIHPFAPLAEGGFFGVDFFFAISGYVISVVTDRPSFSAGPFLVKRIFRLYPLVIVFCLFQYWLHAAPILDVTLDHSWQRILYGMSLLPGSGERYYAVTWTLEHEVIFYLLAAIVVPSFGRMGLAAILALLVAITYFFQPALGSIHIFTMVHADFLAGLLAYQYRERLERLGTLMPAVGSLALYWLAYRGYFQLALASGSFLALVAFMNIRWDLKRFPLRLAVILGDASYSIYMSHWILLYLSYWLAYKLAVDPSIAELWRFSTLGAICIVSTMLWYGFEKPINQFGHRLSRIKLTAATKA